MTQDVVARAVRVDLEYAGDLADTQALGERSHGPDPHLRWHVRAMQRGAMGLLEILVTRDTRQLPPGATPGMTIGPNMVQPHPTIIVARVVGTELVLRVDLAPASPRAGEQRSRG
jgi:hypothetical protein